MDTETYLELLERVRNGDQDALGRLLEQLRPYVRVIVRSVRRGPIERLKDDSDLIQEALLQASQSVCGFRGVTIAEWLGWLRTVTIRSTARTLTRLDLKLDEHLDASIASQLPDSQVNPCDAAIRQENAARMSLALARLPEDMQQVLLGRIVDGLDHAELADQLGRNSGAVRMLYLRALRKLRDVWESEFSSGTGSRK